jgi:hypothetical protein
LTDRVATITGYRVAVIARLIVIDCAVAASVRTHRLPAVGHVQPLSAPQLDEQPSPLLVLPSSQASPVLIFELPHKLGPASGEFTT